MRRVWLVSVAAGAVGMAQAQVQAPSVDAVAARYVKLVLAVGLHDADYVDAYYGPAEWREAVAAEQPSLERIDSDAEAVQRALVGLAPAADADELVRLRHEYLTKQLATLRARVAMLGGGALTFDEESAALYDAVAPQHTEAEFDRALADLAVRLPGEGTVGERYERFRDRFIVPRDKLGAVFAAAIEACRARTLEHIDLPAGETFALEYVRGKSWSGYNWYQGNFTSLIQINTDLPIYIDRAIDLACHEGYPGHHVYNVLLEKHLVRDRGWVEFTVYPLFSPQSLIAEGTANYGIEVAFPDDDRRAFERDVLFPAAGLDPKLVDEYYDVAALVERLSYAGNEGARRYRDGRIDARAAAAWHERYTLASRARAEQRVRFIDQYGAYVINYNLGKDLVARYVERLAGDDGARRWSMFGELISSPRLPSGLVE